MIEEVARGLEADGITRRRKAKQQLEELIARDRRAPCVSRQDWSKLIRSYIEFEVLEIAYCSKKNTIVPLQHAQLLRSIVKQASPILFCNNSRIPLLIKHSIRVCYDLDSHSKYSSIHRDILIDLCDNERFTQCLKIDTLQMIYIYIEKISDDAAFFFSSNCSKLLITFCRTFFVKDGDILASSVCNLLLSLLRKMKNNDEDTYALSLVLSQCYTTIIQIFSTNYVSNLYDSFEYTLSVICHSLINSSLRESQQFHIMKFISCYINWTTRIHYDHIYPLYQNDPLRMHLEFLYIHFTQESFLKSCVLYMIPLSKDRDYRGVLVTDIKLKYTLEVRYGIFFGV